jgi:hypothetical protein
VSGRWSANHDGVRLESRDRDDVGLRIGEQRGQVVLAGDSAESG